MVKRCLVIRIFWGTERDRREGCREIEAGKLLKWDLGGAGIGQRFQLYPLAAVPGILEAYAQAPLSRLVGKGFLRNNWFDEFLPFSARDETTVPKTKDKRIAPIKFFIRPAGVSG